ncbi:MAG TPA: hypothetical protein VHD83_20985 [Puia sp.]|nr:hypothetical protein [Puia sp.]
MSPKNLYLSYCFLILCACSCRQKMERVVAKYKNGMVAIVREYSDRSDTANFIMTQFYLDGKIERTGRVHKGYYVGNIITYYKNGVRSQLDSFLFPCPMEWGACDMILFYYNENGTIAQRFTVKQGVKSGLCQQYDSRGILAKAYYLENDSIKNGDYKEYFDDGRVFRQMTYHMDTIVGKECIFKENGDTLLWDQYYKGQKSFPFKKWLDDGTTVEGDLVDDKSKAVVWTWRNREGKEIKKETRLPGKSGYVVPH